MDWLGEGVFFYGASGALTSRQNFTDQSELRPTTDDSPDDRP